MSQVISRPKTGQAVVIGASIAGLLTARALSDYFERVTIVERDLLPGMPEFRSGVPQARHVHALLARGQYIMNDLFPGLSDELTRRGAPQLNWGQNFYGYNSTAGWSLKYPNGIVTNVVTRTLLEWAVRQRVSKIDGVQILTPYEVEGLVSDESHTNVTGVRARSREDQSVQTFTADLVVDASGRNSKAPDWLQALGYPAPQETHINAYVGYSTRWYEAPSDSGDWAAIVVLPSASKHETRGVALFRVEDNRWLLTISAVNKDYPPTDEEGFIAFVKSLSTPAIYDLISHARPVSPIYGYRYEGSRRRHYETLARRPERFLVVGDASCSFNPIYGQGMSVAAIEALKLRELLAQRKLSDLGGLAEQFPKALAQVTQDAWLMATGEDLRYPGTEGPRPGAAARLAQRYTDKFLTACGSDPVLLAAFHEVMNLVKRPTSLFNPALAVRVMAVLSRKPENRPKHPVPDFVLRAAQT